MENMILVVYGSDISCYEKFTGVNTILHFNAMPAVEEMVWLKTFVQSYLEPAHMSMRSDDTEILKVLVVEDNRMSRMVMEDLLIKAGHKVVLAEDGEIADTILDKERFDIILADHHMPKKTGMQLYLSYKEKIRPEDRAPFVLLTADTQEEIKADAQKAGIAALLEKPVRHNQLFRTIKNLVSKETESEPDELDAMDLEAFQEIFIEDISEKINGLKKTPDVNEKLEILHAMKGICLEMGAGALVDGIARMHEALMENKQDDFVKGLQMFNDVFQKTAAEFGKADVHGKRSILIIEDSHSVRHFYAQKLASMDHEVVVLETLDELTEILQKKRFTDMLIDNHLWDEVSGVDVAIQIQEYLTEHGLNSPNIYLISSEPERIKQNPNFPKIDEPKKILGKPINYSELF